MKKTILYLIVLLFPLNISAQQVDEESGKIIDQHIKSRLDIEKTLIDPQATGKVFVGTFYEVYPGFTFPEGSAGCVGYYLNLDNGKITEMQKLSFDMELTQLLTLLKKEFRLKDEANAVLFEKALNALYPVEEKEVSNVRHLKKSNQWIFLRGKFFDDETAVIVTVNPDGTITKIELILAYQLN
jgi:hypothetical protein